MSEQEPKGSIVLNEERLIDLALYQSLPIQLLKLDRIQQRFALRVAEDEFNPDLNLMISSSLAGSRDGSLSPRGESMSINSAVAPVVNWRMPSGGNLSVTYNTLENFSDFSPDPDRIYPQRQWGANWTVGFSQPLLRGAGIKVATAGRRMARIGEAQNKETLRSVIMSLVSQGLQLLRDFDASSRSFNVAEKAFDRGEMLLLQNQILAEEGMISDLEIKQAEANRATREITLLSAENARDQARLALVRFLQLEDQVEIYASIADTIPVIQTSKLDDFQTAMAFRPDMRSMRLTRQLVDLQAHVARNNQYYDLNLSTGIAGPGTSSASTFLRANNYLLDADHLNWSVGLTLQIPLWGDYSRRQTILASRIALERQAVSEDQLTLNVKTDILNGIRNLRLSKQQIDIARQNSAFAKQAYDGLLDKFKAGLVSTFELRQQEDSLLMAENESIAAGLYYRNALTNYRQAMGVLADHWNIRVEDIEAESKAMEPEYLRTREHFAERLIKGR